MRVVRLVLAAAVTVAATFAGGAAHAGEPYRQQALFEWSRLRIDVIVLPPGHGQIYNDGGLLPAGAGDLSPTANTYARAAERGIALWTAAVAATAEPWLAAALRIDVYVAGRDTIPPAVAADPAIVVAFDETTGPVMGTSWGSGPCVAAVAKAYHASFTEADVTTLTAHEVGHCLGLAHLDQPIPRDDLMQAVYQHPDGLQSTPVHCPSNLNVRVLERVFRRAAGLGAGGGTVSMDPAAYRQPATC